MSQDVLPKAYESQPVEARWRERWEKNRTFTPDMDGAGEPYSIVIPPPNVTGALHMGHALNHTLQDVLCRHARQQGRKVLWLPGTDHAGIATQNVVERALAAEGRNRHDLGREAFVERVWQWKRDYSHRILNQIRALGDSVDWTRERFTMDEGLSRAVRRVFVELYNRGLIYKGKYIVNWCRRCHTALADDEVEHQPEAGKLYHVRYLDPEGGPGLVVATTRPETIVGDTAVCVHPEDGRHAAMVGRTVLVPILDRPVPVIADNYVDREFGTGALKITPCHDINDWQLGHKHHLQFIQVIDEDGLMNAEAGPYAGLSIQAARERIVADLAARGQLVGEEALEHNVGHCYRCKTVVEPHVSLQWFVAATKLAPAARAAVPDMIAMFPENWIKTYYAWLDNIRDWCISRQIWWGHRIPAWTCAACSGLIVAEQAPPTCPQCGAPHLLQDEDVLDTWFSSALWPFSTLGWPDDTPDLRMFYPTTVLVTGFDILFFWVARMIMMGQAMMGQVPFRAVYLHALVRDRHGKKMSKSSGNVIDPIEMIGRYGADALRFTLTAFAAMGRDIRLSEDRIEGYRHFINKLWNASRFVLLNVGAAAPRAMDPARVQALHHCWLLHRLEEIKARTAADLAGYRFNDAAQGLYRFLWGEFCDWYLELIKPDLREDGPARETALYVLWLALREILVLLHPVTPFVTAEIWSVIPCAGEPTDLALEPYPPARPDCLKPEAAADMDWVQQVISAIRTIRAELNIAPSYRLEVLLRPADARQQGLLDACRDMISILARAGLLEVDARAEAPRNSASAVVQGCEVIVRLAGAVDFASELTRLDREIGKIIKELTMLEKKLNNEHFVGRAPADVVRREKERASELALARDKLSALRERFRGAMPEC